MKNSAPLSHIRGLHRSALAILRLRLVFVFVIGSTLAEARAQVPSAVPPNASRVTANVLSRKVWPPGSLAGVPPIVPSNQAFCSVTLKITAAEPVAPELGQIAEPGQTMEAFSSENIPAESVNRKIAATLSLTGDTDGVRWLLKNFQLLP